MSEGVGPQIGATYTDADGRTLTVLHFEKNDRDGREVRGRLRRDGRSHDYSCTLEAWRETWRDKKPSLSPASMKIG